MKKIVILGGGYAGLQCALTLQGSLRPGEAEVTLISKHDYHYPSTLLHRVSLGTYSSRKARVFFRNVLDPARVRFVKDDIQQVDLEGRRLVGLVGEYEFDYLQLSVGFDVNTFNVPGVEEHAYRMTSANSAERLLADMEKRFMDYSYERDPQLLKFAVVGDGFTGIEYAAELTDRTRELCKISGLDWEEVRIYLVGRHETILPMFPAKGGQYAQRRLREMGVTFVLGTAVEVTPEGVMVLDKETGEVSLLEAGTVLWSAGVKGSELMCRTGLPSRGNRVTVGDHLLAPGFDNVFLAGDVAAYTGPGEEMPYPPTGQIAQQMGRYVARQLVALVRGRSTAKPFRYAYRGTVCSLSHTDAVGTVGSFMVRGSFAAFLKNSIENKWFFSMGGPGLVVQKGQFRRRTSD